MNDYMSRNREERYGRQGRQCTDDFRGYGYPAISDRHACMVPSYSGSSNYRERSESSKRMSKNNFRMSLPQFNGKTKWQTFLRQFEAIARSCGWDEEEKLNYLTASLTGDAAEFAFELPLDVIEDYRLLVRNLDQRFRLIKSRETWQQEFYTRHLKSKETTKEFAAELTRLIGKAYPSGLSEEAKQDMLIKQFFDGLEDDDARYQVKYLMHPKTLQEAVDFLREHDSYKGIKEMLKRDMEMVNPVKDLVTL